jgi:hypothetical protein
MVKYAFIFTIGALLSLSCTRKTETVVVELPTLPVSLIYSDDSVCSYIKMHRESNKGVADAYYEKALKLKEENPSRSVYFFKRAITLYPTVEFYKELGSLLIKEGNFKEAAELYSFISLTHEYYTEDKEWARRYVFEKPDEDTFYQYFFCSYLNKSHAPYLIHEAKESGIDMENFKDRILSDNRLKLDTSSLDYKNMIMQFWTDEEIEAFRNSETVFKLFLSTIKDTAEIFEITKRGVQRFNYGNYYERDYVEYDEPGSSSIEDMYVYFLKEKQDKPDNWYRYNYEHLVHLNDSVKVIIYSMDTSATGCPIDMRHIYHQLVTYGIDGKIIDSKIVAYQAGATLATLKFERDKFTISEFRRSWRNPYDQNDFDNDLIKTEAIGEKHFYINSHGKIGESVVEVIQPVE